MAVALSGYDEITDSEERVASLFGFLTMKFPGISPDGMVSPLRIVSDGDPVLTACAEKIRSPRRLKNLQTPARPQRVICGPRF
jgi:hypothetical protein